MYKAIQDSFTKVIDMKRPKGYTKAQKAATDYTKDGISLTLSALSEKEYDEKYSMIKTTGTYFPVKDAEGNPTTGEVFVKAYGEEADPEYKLVFFTTTGQVEGVNNYQTSFYPNRKDDYNIKVTACDSYGVKIAKEKIAIADGKAVSLTAAEVTKTQDEGRAQ